MYVYKSKSKKKVNSRKEDITCILQVIHEVKFLMAYEYY